MNDEYDSADDEDYEPNDLCDCSYCDTIEDCSDCETCSTIEFNCPECLHLEIQKDKLINQLARFMTLYKQSKKKINELETKLKKK